MRTQDAVGPDDTWFERQGESLADHTQENRDMLKMAVAQTYNLKKSDAEPLKGSLPRRLCTGKTLTVATKVWLRKVGATYSTARSDIPQRIIISVT